MHDPIQDVRKALKDAERLLRKLKARHVNTDADKDTFRELAKSYFNNSRPAIRQTLASDDELRSLDDAMQDLLRCAQRRARVEDYRLLVRKARHALDQIETHSLASQPLGNPSNRLEPRLGRILECLRKVHPDAADAFEQGLLDLQSADRKSWRGTAVEFREALRELLDKLAPDSEVMRQPGFKPEGEAKRPTMKQKVIFVMRARQAKQPQTKSLADAVSVVEESIGSLVRSVYDRSSVSVHVAGSRDEVRRVRDCVALVLGELLEVAD
jgi:hypothetical protein